MDLKDNQENAIKNFAIDLYDVVKISPTEIQHDYTKGLTLPENYKHLYE